MKATTVLRAIEQAGYEMMLFRPNGEETPAVIWNRRKRQFWYFLAYLEKKLDVLDNAPRYLPIPERRPTDLTWEEENDRSPLKAEVFGALAVALEKARGKAK